MQSLSSYAGIALRLFKSTVELAVFLSALATWSQSSTPRIVTISFTDAVMETNEAQRDFSALQSKYIPRQSRIETLNKEVQDLQKLLSESGEKLSETERNSRVQALAEKEKQLQRDEVDLRNDSQSDGQAAFQLIAKKVFDFLQDYAKEKGYSVVIERGSDASPVVWFAAQDIDITGDLTSAYNEKSGVAAPMGVSPSRPKQSQPPNAPIPANPRP